MSKCCRHCQSWLHKYILEDGSVWSTCMNDGYSYRGLGNVPGVQSATVRKNDVQQMLYSVTDCLCLAVFCVWVYRCKAH